MVEYKAKTSKGIVELRKPLAGSRNAAILAAERADGTLSEYKFRFELLPYCIKSHPFGVRPIREVLNGLDTEDYDPIIQEMDKMLIELAELKKKSSGSVTEPGPTNQ